MKSSNKFIAIFFVAILSSCGVDNPGPTCQQSYEMAQLDATATCDQIVAGCQKIECIEGAASGLSASLNEALAQYRSCLHPCTTTV